MKNDLLLKAAQGDEVERPPVWLMRQAGRILPQYRKIREQVSGFKELVKTPELACEVTLQPVDELNVDAAIIFSDILVIPEAMGLPYEIVENTGPVFAKTVQDEKDIEQLKIAEPEDLRYVLKAIQLTKKELNGRVPLIGFAGAPWTIFSYMLEGGSSKTFSKAKKWLYTQPLLSHRLLEKITASTSNYLKAQIQAGADIVQIFDSWAGVLSPQQYREFSLKYIAQLCRELKNHHTAPVIVFPKGAFFAMKELTELPCEVIGLDWTVNITETKKITANKKTLQGNADPCLLYADLETIKKETVRMLKEFGGQKHIANLGHGVYPDTELDKVKCFVNTVKEF